MKLPPFPLPTMVMRHAQTERNTEEIPRDSKFTTEVQLTEIGRRQSLQLAKWLSLYCQEQKWKHVTIGASPFQRAQITMDPCLTALQGCGIAYEVFQTDLLREHATGLYGKDSAIDNERWHKLRALANQADAYHYFTPPGGRALADTQTDQLIFHQTMLMKLDAGHFNHTDALLLFCHGIQGRLYIKMRMDYPWPWFWEYGNPANASAYSIDEEGKDCRCLFEPIPRTR